MISVLSNNICSSFFSDRESMTVLHDTKGFKSELDMPCVSFFP